MASFKFQPCRPRSHGYGGQGVKRARRETIGSEAIIASHPSLSVPPFHLSKVLYILAAFLYSVNEAKLNCAITIAVIDWCQIGIESDPIGIQNGAGAAKETVSKCHIMILFLLFLDPLSHPVSHGVEDLCLEFHAPLVVLLRMGMVLS